MALIYTFRTLNPKFIALMDDFFITNIINKIYKQFSLIRSKVFFMKCKIKYMQVMHKTNVHVSHITTSFDLLLS